MIRWLTNRGKCRKMCVKVAYAHAFYARLAFEFYMNPRMFSVSVDYISKLERKAFKLRQYNSQLNR